MKFSHVTGSSILSVALLVGLGTVGCSSDEGDDTLGTGGAGVGGSKSTSTGGKSGATGGASSTAARTGGAPSTGGAVATGGTSSTGAATTGGAPGTGGVTSTSAASTGGASSTSATGVGGTGVGGITGAGTGGSTGTTVVDGGPTDAGVTCDGCITLFVPLTTENTGTDFEADFGAATPADMTVTVVTASVYVEAAGNAGGLRLYAKNDTTYQSLYAPWTNLAELEGGWHEIKLDLAGAPLPGDAGTGFDKTLVRWIGLNVNAGSEYTGAVFGDVTVHVDWIKFSDGVHPDYTFDANAAQDFSINKYNSPVVGSLLNGAPIPD